jgi:hypothetical protein
MAGATMDRMTKATLLIAALVLGLYYGWTLELVPLV